jgi:hypothetical protein
MYFSTLLLISLVVHAFSENAIEKWSMKERFYGFRFQGSKSIFPISEVKDHADERLCFGWIQETINNHIVGEVRCRKDVGLEFVMWMNDRDPNITIKVYYSNMCRLSCLITAIIMFNGRNMMTRRYDYISLPSKFSIKTSILVSLTLLTAVMT